MILNLDSLASSADFIVSKPFCDSLHTRPPPPPPHLLVYRYISCSPYLTSRGLVNAATREKCANSRAGNGALTTYREEGKRKERSKLAREPPRFAGAEETEEPTSPP